MTFCLCRIAQTDTATEYFLGDALGSIRQLTAQNGQVTLAKSYAPYGAVTSSSGSSSSPFAYTGEQMDATGLTYLRARYYSPLDGRFMSKDPSRMESNLYSYTRGNPVNRIDPSGLFSKETIEKNIHFFDFDDTTDGSKSHPHWGFYVLLREISGENAATGATPIHVGYYQIPPTSDHPSSGIKWTSSEEVWLLDCNTIMVGHQLLSEYYKNVIKKQNDPGIWWRDTSVAYYSAFSEDTLPFEKTYVDGSNKTSFPHYAGFAFAIPVSLISPFEFESIYDIDGNEYLGIGFSAGFSAGLSYMEGYSCDNCSNIASSEIKQAISGLCGGFQLNVIRGINIGLLCAGIDPSYSSISLSGARTYYMGAQIGYGGGGSVFIPLPHGTLPEGPMGMSWRFAEYTQLHGLKFADAMKINGW